MFSEAVNKPTSVQRSLNTLLLNSHNLVLGDLGKHCSNQLVDNKSGTWRYPEVSRGIEARTTRQKVTTNKSSQQDLLTNYEFG